MGCGLGTGARTIGVVRLFCAGWTLQGGSESGTGRISARSLLQCKIQHK